MSNVRFESDVWKVSIEHRLGGWLNFAEKHSRVASNVKAYLNTCDTRKQCSNP